MNYTLMAFQFPQTSIKPSLHTSNGSDSSFAVTARRTQDSLHAIDRWTCGTSRDSFEHESEKLTFCGINDEKHTVQERKQIILRWRPGLGWLGDLVVSDGPGALVLERGDTCLHKFFLALSWAFSLADTTIVTHEFQYKGVGYKCERIQHAWRLWLKTGNVSNGVRATLHGFKHGMKSNLSTLSAVQESGTFTDQL